MLRFSSTDYKQELAELKVHLTQMSSQSSPNIQRNRKAQPDTRSVSSSETSLEPEPISEYFDYM